MIILLCGVKLRIMAEGATRKLLFWLHKIIRLLQLPENLRPLLFIRQLTAGNRNILPFSISSVSDEFIFIHSDKPIFVLHAAGFGDEIGGAILPTIDGCTGPLSVSFVRSKDGDVNQANAAHNGFI